MISDIKNSYDAQSQFEQNNIKLVWKVLLNLPKAQDMELHKIKLSGRDVGGSNCIHAA